MTKGDSLIHSAGSSREKGGSIHFFKYLLLGMFLLFQVYLFFGRNFQVLDYFPYVNQEPLPLFGDNKNISQDFRSPGPLCRIDIMMANYKLKPKSGTLRLSIFKNGHRLFLKNYPADTVDDNRFYSFTFEPGKFPAGNYRLLLNYFPDNPQEKLAAWTTKDDLYPYGKLYVNQKLEPGDLTFRVYYSSTIWKESSRWLTLSSLPGIRSALLPAGLIFLLVTINFLFYFFTRNLLK